ncbi:TRAP transporter small permease [Gracilibacillus sp. D59]|uniref:TRAP transporter small permease n=1 Tax=Gracilibacillus sp. D59 TaxID=3457434 RepID=UPI003FCCE98A
MDKIARYYVKIENFITNILMFGVVVFVFIAAVMRWVGYPIVWSVEFAQFLFVWVIFLGANRALRNNKHIGVDFFTKRMPEKVRNIVQIFTMFTIIVFLVYVGIFGILLSIENSARSIGNLSLSYSLITVAAPIGCLLMVITILLKIKELLLTLKG